MTMARLSEAVAPDQLVRRSVARIRAELPAYQAVDLAEHTSAVGRQQRNQLAALAQGEPVAGPALAEAAALARIRARQGIEIEVLIGAYHLGDQELWRALVEAAAPDTRDQLPEAATLLFASLHALSTALTAAHAQASLVVRSRHSIASQRLVELLVLDQVGVEAMRQAEEVGFNPAGVFVAVAWRDPGSVLGALETAGAVVAAGQHSGETLLVCQGLTPGQIQQIVTPLVGSGRAGIGLARPGLDGAAISLGDARLAAIHPGVAAFENVWPDACVVREADRLAGVVHRASQVAADNPHLAEAVRAFAEADLQIARAATALHLHPNSLSYRLDRWAALTGWHPRTFDGLRRSLAALSLIGEGCGAAGVEVLDQT